MSKPSPQPSILTWILAGTGLGLWAIGTMGWVPDAFLHPISYVLILAAALTADPVIGRTGGSNLQLFYTVIAWLMVALIAVTEALSFGGILFFALIALTMTFMFFHPSFRLKTRITLYLVLVATVWTPVLYGVMSPEAAESLFGPGTRMALLALALGVSTLFVGFARRWLTVRKPGED